jgi:hypothetical protein
MNFSDWNEALPFALAVGRGFARRQPFQLDVESVVMMALWKAQTRGAVFSRAYVALRVRGALQDEMRTLAEGQRGNYQDRNRFGDIADFEGEISGSSEDPVERIDRARFVESLPRAARYLVDQIAAGHQQDEIARRLGVHPVRVSQVVADLRRNPRGLTQLPGGVDYFERMRRAHRQMVQDAYARTGTVTGVALELGVSMSNASRWVNSRKPVLVNPEPFPSMRKLAQRLVQAAFVRAEGSPQTAGRLLGTDNHTASSLARRFAPELERSNRRPDLSVEAVVRMRKRRMSMAAIAERCGVSEHTIRNRCRAAAEPVPTLCKVRSDLPDSAFAELRAQGLKHREIAERLGVSMPTVCVRLRRAKWIAKCGEASR